MVQTIVTEVGVDVKAAVSVAMAMDTRPSSPLMAKAVAAGVAAAGGTVTDFGLLTTPQLHYVVRCTNDPACVSFCARAAHTCHAQVLPACTVGMREGGGGCGGGGGVQEDDVK